MKKRTKKTLSVATKVFTRLLLATVLCAILYVSMNVISTAFFSDVVGYQIFEQNENQEVSMVVEHYYQSGDVIQTAETMELADNQMFSAIRVVSDSTKRVMDVVSQVLMLIVLCVFPYHILWEFGNRDDTNVRYRGQRPDPWRGIKIGLLSMTPFFVSWALLVASKYVPMLSGYLPVFRIFGFAYMPYINLVIGTATSAVEAGRGRLILLLPIFLVVPIVCAVAYRMGGQQFSLAEFFTFVRKQDSATESDEEI